MKRNELTCGGDYQARQELIAIEDSCDNTNARLAVPADDVECSGLVSLQVEPPVKLVVSDDGGPHVRTTTSTPDVGRRRPAHEAAAHIQEALKRDTSRALICGNEIYSGSSTASSPSLLAPRVWHSPMSAQV